MIIATITDHLTDEDSQIAGDAAKRMSDAFMSRPSLEDNAMEGITSVVNDLVYSHHGEDRYEPAACAFAVLFTLRNRARWITGGGSMVYHFADGQLLSYSQCKDAPALGLHSTYTPELEDAFELQPGQNAFLLCSAELAKQITPDQMEQTLRSSETAQQWLDAIVAQVGQSRQYCAQAVILPQKKSWFRRLFREQESQCS